jgi:hypothetical protein
MRSLWQCVIGDARTLGGSRGMLFQRLAPLDDLRMSHNFLGVEPDDLQPVERRGARQRDITLPALEDFPEIDLHPLDRLTLGLVDGHGPRESERDLEPRRRGVNDVGGIRAVGQARTHLHPPHKHVAFAIFDPEFLTDQ